jgi:protein tyrosine phosphatase
MSWKDEISDIIDHQNLAPSFSYWISILNYAEKHKNELSLIDLEYLAHESERCRAYWNQQGSDITKIDVNPNIHRIIEQKITEALDDEDIPPEENKSPYKAVLAAMPR